MEYLQGGDVATVAVQYSYLQSPLSLIIEPGRSQESGAAVFRVIYRYWRKLPKDSRRKLYLFGLSLGSLGSGIAPGARLDRGFVRWRRLGGAALSQPHRARDPARPGRRIAPLAAGLRGRLELSRDRPRRQCYRGDCQLGTGADRYIVYPSDAIVFFEESMFFREPQWMIPPRGEDASPLLQWFPIVTALQVGVDMLFAADVPPGHGHDYAVADYIEAWTAVTGPQNWTDEDAGRLATEIETNRVFTADLVTQRPIPGPCRGLQSPWSKRRAKSRWVRSGSKCPVCRKIIACAMRDDVIGYPRKGALPTGF